LHTAICRACSGPPRGPFWEHRTLPESCRSRCPGFIRAEPGFS